jgi:hypothetical protein
MILRFILCCCWSPAFWYIFFFGEAEKDEKFAPILVIFSSMAVAQDGFGGDNEGFGGIPSDGGFIVPNEVDFGPGCSRRRPRECTPEEREAHNLEVAWWRGTGGAVAGAGVGIAAGAAASTATTPAGGATIGHVTQAAVTPAIVGACYAYFRIPAPT